MAKIGRNDPCPCGSGRKYKKCCGQDFRGWPFDPHAIAAGTPNPTGRPRIQTVAFNQSVRAVGSRIYVGPPKETFHEFIIQHLMHQLGKPWFEAEKVRPQEEQHQVMRWWLEWHEFKAERMTAEHYQGGIWAAQGNGHVYSLLALAHDVYQLAHSARLPVRWLKRLRDRHEFQGVRYELAVASLFVRIGCELEFLSDATDQRHPEFIARDRLAGVEVAVEAKSRRRPGVLHEKGDLDLEQAVRGDIKYLLGRAIEQLPENKPGVIFVDINAAPSSVAAIWQRPWIQDVDLLFQRRGSPSPENPDPFSMLVLTNFAYHYAADNEAGHAEYALLLSRYPRRSLPSEFLHRLHSVVEHYADIPP